MGIPNLSHFPDIAQSSDRGTYDFKIYGLPLKKEKSHNPRTADHVGITLGPLTKLGRRNKESSKMMMSFGKIMTLFLLFQYMANLEQSRSERLDERFVKYAF